MDQTLVINLKKTEFKIQQSLFAHFVHIQNKEDENRYFKGGVEMHEAEVTTFCSRFSNV